MSGTPMDDCDAGAPQRGGCRMEWNSARRQAEADAQIAVATLDLERQPLALAAPAMRPVGDPAKRRQAGGVEFLGGRARHPPARLHLDYAALRRFRSAKTVLGVWQTRGVREIPAAGKGERGRPQRRPEGDWCP